MADIKRDRERDRRPSRPRFRRPRLLHCTAVAAVSLLALAGLLILVFWLAVRPSLPRYSVVKTHVQGFNVTGSTLTATFNLTVEARNPNRKVALFYDRVEVSVWYDGQMLASEEAAPFFQPPRGVRMLKIDPAARSAPLPGAAAERLRQDRSAGAASVEVRLRMLVRFKVGRLKTDRYALRAYCSPVPLGFARSSRARFEMVSCKVNHMSARSIGS